MEAVRLVTFVDCFILNFSISTKDMIVPWTTFRFTGAWHRSLEDTSTYHPLTQANNEMFPVENYQ